MLENKFSNVLSTSNLSDILPSSVFRDSSETRRFVPVSVLSTSHTIYIINIINFFSAWVQTTLNILE